MGIPRRMWAVPSQSRRAVESFAPPVLTPEELRTLATEAIEAATHAGAEFADIRVSDLREYQGGAYYGSSLYRTFGYGIRVRVNGREACVGAADPTRDGVVQAAQTAVTVAREQSQMGKPAPPLAPTPVVRGDWASSMEIDPFAISPDDHVVIAHGITTRMRRLHTMIYGGFSWKTDARVYASSDGSLVTQRSTSVNQNAMTAYSPWRPGPANFMSVPGFTPQTAGVESVLGDAFHSRMEAAVDDLVALGQYPPGLAEVGRRTVILDGETFAGMLSRTVVSALTLNRVLGEEQDGEGTSVLAPPESVIGQPLFSPLVNLWVEAEVPAYGAMRWDDEGVETHTTPLIEQGIVRRYLGTRGHVAQVDTSNNHPTVALGVSFAADVGSLPIPRPGTLSVRPPDTKTSLTDLIRTVDNGYVVRGGRHVIDQQGAGGVIAPAMIFEVQRGHIVRHISNARLEFSTKKLLRSVIALGGIDSVVAGTGGIGGDSHQASRCVPCTRRLSCSKTSTSSRPKGGLRSISP